MPFISCKNATGGGAAIPQALINGYTEGVGSLWPNAGDN